MSDYGTSDPRKLRPRTASDSRSNAARRPRRPLIRFLRLGAVAILGGPRCGGSIDDRGGLRSGGWGESSRAGCLREGGSRAFGEALVHAGRRDPREPVRPFVRGFDEVVHTMQRAASFYRDGEAVGFDLVAKTRNGRSRPPGRG